MILAFAGASFAGGTIQWPTACFFDSNGDPLSGGLLNSYVAGTTTRKSLYSDREATTAHTNPEVLDANGCTEVYGIGTYKLVLTDAAASTTYFTDDNVTVSAQSVSYFYPNYNAADQGATGNSDTIKYAIDTCSTNACTIVLQHNSGSARTEYILDTDETAGAVVKFVFEEGAEIKPAAGDTLTAYSPEHIIAGKRQQIVDLTDNSTNPLLFTTYGTVYPGWTGATGDGTTDDYAAINALLQAGNTIEFPYGTYNLETTLTIAVNNIVLKGDSIRSSRAIIRNAIAGAASDCIEFTTSDPDGVAVFGSASGIENLIITASSNNMTDGAALKVTKHSGFSCRGVTILKHPYGIDLHGVINSQFSDFYLYHTGTTLVNNSAALRIDGQLNDDASYTTPWTTTFDNFHINPADYADYCILILQADGMHFSNGYIAGAHEDMIRIAPDVAAETAVNCFFNNVFLDSTAFSDNGIYITSATASVQAILINNANISGCDNRGLVITGNNGTDVLVSNSKFQIIDAGAIYTDSTSTKLVITGNSFFNCITDAGSAAVVTLQNGNITNITGNTFYNSAATDAYGVLVTGANHNQISITGNSFENFSQVGVGFNAPTIADGVKMLGNTTDATLKIPDIGMVEHFAELADESTPSVIRNGIRYNIFITAGTTNDPITDFDDGITGQVITIIAEHECIVTDGTNIFLSGSANWTMTATDTLTLICKNDNKWYEIARSDSGA